MILHHIYATPTITAEAAIRLLQPVKAIDPTFDICTIWP